MWTQPLHLELPAACSVACLLAANSFKNNYCNWLLMNDSVDSVFLCFQDWHLFHHPCDGYTLCFQILRVMTSSAEISLVRVSWPMGSTTTFGHPLWKIAIMTWNEFKVRKCFTKTNSTSYLKKTIQLVSFPSPWYKKNNLFNFTRLHHTPDSLIQASHWSKSYKYPKHCNLLEAPPSVQLFHKAFWNGTKWRNSIIAPVRTLGIWNSSEITVITSILAY